ncbi:MAG: hypothetical protein AB8G05_19475 [Oligoflexales bacterium]
MDEIGVCVSWPGLKLSIIAMAGNLACQEAPVINRRSAPPPDYGKFRLTDNPREACEIQNSSLSLFNQLELDFQMRELVTKGQESINQNLPEYLSAQPLLDTYMKVNRELAHISFQTSYEGIPVCGGPIRVHLRDNLISLRAQTKFIELPTSLDQNIEWGSKPNIIDLMMTTFSNKNMTGMEISETKQCLMVENGSIFPAWQFWSVNDFGHNYTGFVDSKTLIKSYQTNFHASGLFKVHEKNIDNKIVNIEIEGMQRSGYLCNNLFMTKVDLKSEILDKNTYFEAASMFVNANKISEKIKIIGGSPWHPEQILLYLTDSSNGNTSYNPIGFSNAQDKLHTILIPRTEGFFENLRTDSDVLYHEYGHHLVYKTVQELSNPESFAIHDGFADFFAYMINGDNCLAETICRNPSSACSKPGECLRSAANNLRLSNLPKVFSRGGHYKHSELISALLWDTKQAANWTDAEGLSWVYNAIEYLDHAADFDSMIYSLIESDTDLFQSKNKCVIFNQAIQRGFSGLTLQNLQEICNESG